jgi:hypothetical protein
MKTIHLFTISTAIAFTTVAFSVGCSAPAVQSVEPDADGKTTKKGKTGDDNEKESGEKTQSSQSSQSSSKQPGSGGAQPGGAQPGGEQPGGEQPGGAEPGGADPAEACYSQCIGANPAAVQIDQQWVACANNCGEQDEQCIGACDDQMFQTCEQNAAACDLLFQCADQCFGAAPEGP